MTLPDVSCDLMWIDGRIFVVGPLRRAIAAVGTGRDVAVLRLDPLVASRWFGIPLNELTDKVISLDDLDLRAALDLRSHFEKGRLPAYVNGSEFIPMSLSEKRALEACRQLESRRRVGAVASHLGMSERQFERVFLELTGLSPKTYERILRFRSAIFAVKRGAGLADAAYFGGYADQAHFSREVRSFTGKSPTELLSHVGNVQDVAKGIL